MFYVQFDQFNAMCAIFPIVLNYDVYDSISKWCPFEWSQMETNKKKTDSSW